MRPELRWLVLTVLIVGVLLGISALALDRPDVIWTEAGPQCPACRSEVAMYAGKCKECGTDFDWTIAPDESSPISTHSLSRLEAEELRTLVEKVGEERATLRVAGVLKITPGAAKEWLQSIGRGRCGNCGGTGDDLDAPDDDRGDCPVCFGQENCIASGGDGHMVRGSQAAARALERFHREAGALSNSLPPAVRAEELEKLAREFLADHAGTVEASKLPYWKERTGAMARPTFDTAAADVGRRRIDMVLKALRSDSGQ